MGEYPRIVIGLNAYHADAAACILVDGKLIAAAEEERFRRIKHWAGFPSEAIRYCLKEAGVSLSEVDSVAINQDAKANIRKKLTYTITKRPDLKMVLDRIRNRRERSGVADRLVEHFPDDTFHGRVVQVEHHLAHLSSAFHVSPFSEAVVVSIDGFGDFASAAWGVGKGTEIILDDKVYFPHSLGIFYMAITQYLGFPHWGDEYKVMGLAPYGQADEYLPRIRELVHLRSDGSFELNLRYFRHHIENVDSEWEGGTPHSGEMFSHNLEELLGPRRQSGAPLDQKHRDIARAAQVMYEEAFFNLLGRLYEKYKLPSVAIAGGCGMNSVANGKILLQTPFKQVYVQSAAGDAGGAIGAAFIVWHKRGGARGAVHDHAYWGPSYSNEEIRVVLDGKAGAIIEQSCVTEFVDDETVLCQRTAAAVEAGSVVGWFQGRMEWGPRALGNRSILGDPRRADMKDILNLKIKRRESFRPFAPSILREHVDKWFEQNADVPFMMQVFQIRESQRSKIPAVTHIDGSGRLQTVYKHTNPRYHKMIEMFCEATGVPMVLNTSFNENEPVVCRPEEALDCFLRTKMDVLVMGNWFLKRL